MEKLKARWRPYRLDFTFEARTSRASMWHKPTYFIEVWRESDPSLIGIGECNLFSGLSEDDKPDYEDKLSLACASNLTEIAPYSSLLFGIESALANLKSGKKNLYFPSSWTKGTHGIPINGLIWMGSKETMLARIKEKIGQGFHCLKLKIGGIDFDDELDVLRFIRDRFCPQDLELRLDANGAFTPINALERIEKLSQFKIHSLEQPIKAHQPVEMARICKESSIPIALDEELIGVTNDEKKRQLLNFIKPSYIILKPALCGGFKEADKWIAEAKNQKIKWWVTSALESNIGLSAIAQWTVAKHEINMPQGLGTGQLYSNNIPSPIYQVRDSLYFKNQEK